MSAAQLDHLVQAYGLWVLFAVVTLESLGVPMPSESALVATALYAGTTHGVGIPAIIAVAAAGAILGDNIGYLIGRSAGVRLVARFGRYVGLDEGRLKVGQYLFLRHGGKIVFFGRFVALLRTFAALLAGINRMDWRHFLLMNALGGICWATVIGGGAYIFGSQMKHIAGPVSLALSAVAIVVVIAGIVFFRRHEHDLRQRAEAAFPGPWYHSIH